MARGKRHLPTADVIDFARGCGHLPTADVIDFARGKRHLPMADVIDFASGKRLKGPHPRPVGPPLSINGEGEETSAYGRWD